MYDIFNPDPEVYLSDNYLVLDFETTKAPLHVAVNPKSQLCLASWLFRGKMTSTLGDELSCDQLLSDIEQADFIVAHNSKFELQWLKRAGVRLRGILPWDTQLAEWVLSAGIPRPKGWYTLHETAKRRRLEGKIDVVKLLWDAGVETYDIPTRILVAYCERDVSVCHNVFLQQREELGRDG
jgi:hypothetical protein